MLSAGLILSAAAAARAENLDPDLVRLVSDFQGPMAALPPLAPRYGDDLLPAPEVDSIVRENGFSRLGLPQLRGVVYTVSVVDPDGDDGRLVIDARSGRIISFVRARRLSDNLNDDLTVTYGPSAQRMPRRFSSLPPRPPAAVPHVASRTPTVPLPRPPQPAEAKPPAAAPVGGTSQRSAAVQAKPAEAPVASPAAAKPVGPQILPTQPLPAAQGLEY
jgi:hypothetical protein